MTKEEREDAINFFKEVAKKEVGNYCKLAIEALEQEPCEDCISRQAVLDGLASIAKVKARSDAQKSLMGRIMFFVEQLPPVTPKEKTGRWIDDEFGSKCSCCGIYTHLDKFDRPMKFKYCSMCGAKMVEPQESEDCRDCKKWEDCPCGKEGHENGTSIGYSIGECKNYEPCEDAISRQEAINVVHRYFEHYLQLNDDICLDGLRSLPSVTPKGKTGRWIFKNDNIAIPMGYYQCSECEEGKVLHKDNFCPTCGMRMQEVSE